MIILFMSTVGTTGGCPDGWYKLINRCYRLYGRLGDETRNFDEANSFCRSFEDGNLASIQLQSQQCKYHAVAKLTDLDVGN